jgi:hypothetical protein
MWSFERIAGAWGIGFSDRFLRFLGISVLLHVAAAPVTYVIWHAYLRPGSLGAGQSLPLWLWPVAAMYAAVPIFLGTVLATGLRDGAGWAQALNIGSDPPTAWDSIFSNEPEGWVLIRLKSGRWIGGQYADGSYAGGYPEAPDLFLAQACAVDQENEEFVLGPNGQPEPIGPPSWGLLVRWEEIEYLEVTPT